MTQDVRQWLAEIKSLQQKLTEAHQERDQAYASAANWRSLYEAEAKQRRTEANLAQQTIALLKAELAELQAAPATEATRPEDIALIQSDVARLQSTPELKQRLVQALLECDRLTHALRAEQAAHTQTRRGLTTALGDTVEMLTKERMVRSQHSSTPPAAATGVTKFESAKTPSLELPPFD